MVDRRKLIIIIRNKFPRIRFPEDYADILLSGLKLKALDRKSAKRRRDFSNVFNHKVHAFSKCHKELDLLIKVEKAEYNISPMSEREYVVFDFSKAQKILNLEKDLLLEHIGDSQRVRKITTTKLKISVNSSLTSIRRKMNEGNIFKQGSTYEKIFDELKDNKIRSTGYLWFGIRPIPIPNYYLSRKAIGLINK